MLKYSRQREFIRNYLNTHRTHPTAETVYLDMKQEFPNISLGTVYRNLRCLTDLGEILRISSDSGPDRYDGCTAPHYHFTCTKCGRLSDIDINPKIRLDEMAEESFAGTITGHSAHFFGLCPECNKQ